MNTIKAKKATAMRRYHRLRLLTRFLRLLEACAALLALSWLSSRLPHTARTLLDILHSTASFVLSQSFVFLIGNAIVLVLFSKFRHHTYSDDLYSPDFLTTSAPAQQEPETAEVFEDKEVVPEVLSEVKVLRRTRSAGARRGKTAELRRSETMVVERKGEEKVDAPMSLEEAEEFRRTIEAFIAKQWRFQEEESMAIVSWAGAESVEAQS